MKRFAGFALFLVCFGLAGCGDDPADSCVLDRTEPTSAPQACEQVADAYGKACERCNKTGGPTGDPYKDCYDLVLQSVGGSCSNVVGVRDLDEFFNVCLPWIDCVTCEELSGVTGEPSCAGQLYI